MKLYSTNDTNNVVDLKTAVLKSLASDRGLYMPQFIPKLKESFFNTLDTQSFQEIAFQVSAALMENYISANDLMKVCRDTIQFTAPVKHITNNISTLELFHGPSLAFKDFGARYMASLMSHFNKGADKKLTILVATSGDTGGAVAAGFYKVPNVEVIILYPSGRVSPLQEKQLTALGENIEALEIDGSFDDCQSLVKSAFLDDDLNRVYALSSANSINIARLIPQSFYYFEAFKQLPKNKPIVFCVPSGNFGNLTAGLIAKKMGLPVHQFIAATNLNNVVPQYLKSGKFLPMESIATISNAMDVGNPSNFQRMLKLYQDDWNALTQDVVGYFCDDQTTRSTMLKTYTNHRYVLDPHGAIGFKAAEEYLTQHPNTHVCFLETAHPSKFLDVVENTIESKIEIPQRLARLENEKKVATQLDKNFGNFKSFLLTRK